MRSEKQFGVSGIVVLAGAAACLLLSACNDGGTAVTEQSAALPAAAAAELDVGACTSTAAGATMVNGVCLRSSKMLEAAAPIKLAAAVAGTVPDAGALMDWAQTTFPSYFPSKQSNQTLGAYTYRYYPETQNYIGVADGVVYLFGPVSNNLLTSVGKLSDFSCRVYPDSCTSAGSNTASVVAAANAFAATLSSSQQATLNVAYTLNNARQWSNLPAALVKRNGVAFADMTAAQQAAAKTLIDSALSSIGSKLHADIRVADNQLLTLGANSSQYGDGGYYIVFVGTPSTSSKWLLQLTGHHLTYNIAYNSSYKSPTPEFVAVEPNLAFTYNGVTYDPLLAQRTAIGNLGAALAAYPAAKLSGSFDDVLFGANGTGGIDGTLPKAYPTGASNRGVLYGALSAADQALVKAAILAYVNTQTGEIADALSSSYLSDSALAQTYAAYATDTSISTKGNYFRIDGPRVWIEWTVQNGIVVRNGIHPHSIWRDKVADYGGDF